MAYGTLSLDSITTSTGQVIGASSASTMKNRIINGDMRIDQRRSGTSFTPPNGGQQYSVDRWSVQFDTAVTSVQRVSDAPTGFQNSLKVTITTATTSGQAFICQNIEGYNWADIMYGSASAKTVTASFWVKSSIPGTYTFAMEDNAGTRCYTATYVINTANTWQYVTVTIPGETTGTNWQYTTGCGVTAIFDLGCASAGTPNTWNTTDTKRASGAVQLALTVGATFQVTGVQIEVGNTATTFDYRDYSREFEMCQRYFCKSYDVNIAPGTATALGMVQGGWQGAPGVGGSWGTTSWPVRMRATPTVSIWDSAGNSGYFSYTYAAAGTSQSLSNNATGWGGLINPSSSGVMLPPTSSQASSLSLYHYTATAEL